MIIECVNCNKNFLVDSSLIPSSGRSIQCGSCNHIWFFKKHESQKNIYRGEKNINKDNFKSNNKIENIAPYKTGKNPKNLSSIGRQNITKSKSIVKIDKSRTSFSFAKLLSYTLVLIISFITFIVILDTFKTPLYKILPELEFLLFSFYEILKDIKLFLIDLL